MNKGLAYAEKVKLLEANIEDIKMAMAGNPLSKRWQILQIELSVTVGRLTALKSKRFNNAPLTGAGSKFAGK